jgi:hypothetical protein
MNVNQKLLLSAANGDLQGIIDSLSSGADINSKDSNGFTALQFASYNNQLQCVEVLIDSGAEINVFDFKNYNNYTPLHFAAAFNQLELAKAILKSGTNPHIPNGDGKYPVELSTSQDMKNLLLNDQQIRNERPNFTSTQPNFVPTETRQCAWRNVFNGVGCCKIAKKAGKIAGALFFLLPLLYCLFTPFAFPWFIYPCGLILAFKGFRKLKENKEDLTTEGVYKLYVHTLIFATVNILNFIACLWLRTIFASSVVAIVWGAALAVHALKTKYQKSKRNNSFFIHAMFFVAFLLVFFVIYTHITCVPQHHQPKNHNGGRYSHPGYSNQNQGSQHHYRRRHERSFHKYQRICHRTLFGMALWFSPMLIWAVILFIHYLRFKGKNEIKVCGVRISFLHFSNEEEETQPQDEINVQEPQENQPQEHQQVEEVPNFNGQNVQILYPKVL